MHILWYANQTSSNGGLARRHAVALKIEKPGAKGCWVASRPLGGLRTIRYSHFRERSCSRSAKNRSCFWSFSYGNVCKYVCKYRCKIQDVNTGAHFTNWQSKRNNKADCNQSHFHHEQKFIDKCNVGAGNDSSKKKKKKKTHLSHRQTAQ